MILILSDHSSLVTNNHAESHTSTYPPCKELLRQDLLELRIGFCSPLLLLPALFMQGWQYLPNITQEGHTRLGCNWAPGQRVEHLLGLTVDKLKCGNRNELHWSCH